MASPSVDRSVLILDFLTTHPGRGFTLTELSRELRISKATTHVLLSTLTKRALLQRNPNTLEYRLGVALIPMGTVAERRFPALKLALHQAETLADTFEAECVVTVATGDEILVVGRAGVPGPLTQTYREGQRHLLAAPGGPIYLAWAKADAVERWLDRSEYGLSEAEREHYRAVIAFVRTRGYSVGFRRASWNDLHEVYETSTPYTPEGRDEINRARAALAHDIHYLPAGDDIPTDAELSFISAPVFDADGSLLLVISLLTSHSRAQDIPKLARATVRAASRVTGAIDGRRPDDHDGSPSAQSSQLTRR